MTPPFIFSFWHLSCACITRDNLLSLTTSTATENLVDAFLRPSIWVGSMRGGDPVVDQEKWSIGLYLGTFTHSIPFEVHTFITGVVV